LKYGWRKGLINKSQTEIHFACQSADTQTCTHLGGEAGPQLKTRRLELRGRGVRWDICNKFRKVTMDEQKQ